MWTQKVLHVRSTRTKQQSGDRMSFFSVGEEGWEGGMFLLNRLSMQIDLNQGRSKRQRFTSSQCILSTEANSWTKKCSAQPREKPSHDDADNKHEEWHLVKWMGKLHRGDHWNSMHKSICALRFQDSRQSQYEAKSKCWDLANASQQTNNILRAKASNRISKLITANIHINSVCLKNNETTVTFALQTSTFVIAAKHRNIQNNVELVGVQNPAQH